MDTLLENIRNKYLPGTSTSASASANAQSATSQTNGSGGDALLGDIRRRYGVSNNEFVAGTAKSEVVVDPKKAEPKDEPTFFERFGNMISGGVKSTAGQYAGAARAQYEAGQGGRTQRNVEQMKELQWAVARAKADYDSAVAAGQSQGMVQATKNELDNYTTKLKAYADVLGEGVYDTALAEANSAAANLRNGSNADDLYASLGKFELPAEGGIQEKATKATSQLVNDINESAAADIAEAKEGLGFVGQILVDVGVGATQMAADAATNIIAPGVSRLALAQRVFGGSATETEQAGASIGKQVAYGTAQAALEVALSAIGGVLDPVYGKGVTDDIIEGFINKIAKTPAAKTALKLLANAAGEGLEEAASAILSPALESIYNGKKVGENYSKETISNALYDALIGGTLGLVGGEVNLAANSAANALTNTITRTLPKFSQMETANDTTATAETATNKSGVEAIVEPATTQQASAFESALIESVSPSARQVSEIAKNPTALAQLGIDPNGKTASQLRAEVKAAIEAHAVTKDTNSFDSSNAGDYTGVADSEFDSNGMPIFAQSRSEANISATDFNALNKTRRGASEKYGLTPEESSSLGRYTQLTYRFLNDPLRSGTASEYQLRQAQKLVDALKKFPVFSGRTYRNLSFDNEAAYTEFLNAHAAGNTVSLKAFTSTSKRPNGYPRFGEFVAHMIIDGYSGADISETFGLPRQQEVILLPGTSIEVLDVTTANDGKPLIIAKEVAANGNSGNPENQRPARSDAADNYENTRYGRSSDGGRELREAPQNLSRRDGLVSERGKRGGDSDSGRTSSVGAAQQGFDPFTALQNQYGTLPSGENPVRSDDVPVSTNGTDRVSQSVVTEKGARVTPDEFVPLIENETVKGGFSFIPITNDATVQKAVAEIESIGWDAALREWTAKVRKGITSADVEAMGALLYNNAVNSGDFRLALDILADYNVSGRNAARALQARRILKKLEPQSRLYMIERSIQRMVDDMDIDQQITIPKSMLDAYTNAESEAVRDDVVGEIQQYVADNIPPTKMDKWKALRYTNMLGNFKTQVRNVAGNITMAAINDAKNAVAALLETAARGKAGRAHSVAFGKELLDAARADFAENRDFIVDEYRYADDTPTDAFTRGVMEKRTIFKWKPLEGYRELTNYAMNNAKFGDEAFSRRAYSRALASYLKANNVTAETFNDPSWRAENTEFLDRARAAAKKNAQEATFRDHNTLSDWVSKIGRRPDTPAAVKAIAEGVLPFRRTPANVLVRAAEYSPLGLVRNAVDIAKAARGGDISGADVIDGIAKTLTGSGIFALGMLLRNAGLLRGGSDDDEKQQAFDELTGHQDYSLELPDGTSITLDWLTPAAMPLFVGAELYDLIKDGGFELKDIERAILSIADPMLEMSMIQGVNDTLDSLQYAEGNNLGQLVGAATLSYLMQGVTNSLLGQITRSFEDESTMTYADKDSALPDWMQKELGKVARKTPFLDYNQIPYIDAWGRTEEQGGFMERVVNNLFNPAYVDTVEVGKVETELQRLYDNLGDDAGGIFPTRADKSFSVNGENRNLSADEYVKYATAKGQYSYRFVDEAVNSAAYKNMSDAEKAKLIGNLYGYANYKAKREVVPSYDNETYQKVAQAEKVMSPLEYYVMRDSYDYNNNNAVSQAEAQRYLDTTDLSQTDKAFVWTIINKSWKTNPYK